MNTLNNVGYISPDTSWKQPHKTTRWYKGNRCSFLPDNKAPDQVKTEITAINALQMKLASALEERDLANQNLKKAKQSIVDLKEEIRQLKDDEGTLLLSSKDLKVILKKSHKISLKLTQHLWDINVLAGEKKPTMESIKNKSPLLDDLQKNLIDYDFKYDALIKDYQTLMPFVEKILIELQNSIKDATHDPISEKNIRAFSAKQSISVDKIKLNEEEFDSKLNSCKEVYEHLKGEIAKIKSALNDQKNDLNLIDHQISILENPNSWNINLLNRYWGKKERLSPLDYQFKLVDEATSKEKAVEGA